MPKTLKLIVKILKWMKIHFKKLFFKFSFLEKFFGVDYLKILHTSDLHLGKSLSEESFQKDQEHILREIIKVVEEKGVSVVMIPGDIYDKTIPRVEAVKLFDKFLTTLSKMGVRVLITSGNHDSNERLGFGSEIFNEFNIHIATSYEGKIEKVSVDDVDFYLLPFLKPFHLKHLIDDEEYENIKSTNDMMKWILSNENIDKSKKNILLAHQFVQWGEQKLKRCESENASSDHVGTLDSISVDLFDDFDYVALGHLHRPQLIKRETVRYSGTPLKYSFSEYKDKKSVVIIDSDDIENFELVELHPLRDMRILKGTFEEVMNMEPSDDIIKVELLDENTIISPMERIKQRFENAIALEFVNRRYSDSSGNSDDSDLGPDDISAYELFKSFFKEQNGREMNEKEEEYIKGLIESLEGDE